MIRVRVGRGERRRGAIVFVEGGGERRSADGGRDVRAEGAGLELRRHHFRSPESELDSLCVRLKKRIRRGVTGTAGCFVKL